MSRRIARPYAAALFAVMSRQEPSALREVQRQLETVGELFRRDPRLLRVFEVPSVSPERKRGLLAELGGRLELRPVAQRLLAALEQHVRLRFLPDVVAAFGELVDRREGVVRGGVELPGRPSKEQLDALSSALAAILGARVELDGRERPELLAGFIVRLGSRVFDGSLRTQLARFAAATVRR